MTIAGRHIANGLHQKCDTFSSIYNLYYLIYGLVPDNSKIEEDGAKIIVHHCLRKSSIHRKITNYNLRSLQTNSRSGTSTHSAEKETACNVTM